MLAVISDDCEGDPEASDDVLADKADDVIVGDVDEGFCFHPLRKVVRGSDKKFEAPRGDGHLSHDVHPPLREGPRTKNRSEVASRLMN